MNAPLDRIADAIEQMGLHMCRNNHPIEDIDDLARRVEVACLNHRTAKEAVRSLPDYDDDDDIGTQAIERRLRTDPDLRLSLIPRVNMSGKPV